MIGGDESARYEAEQNDYYYRKAQQEVAADHAAAVARLKEAGDGLENELNDLRAAAVLHGGILLRNRIDEALAAWRKAKESA